jgi:UPF0716 protein FxsA
MLRLSREEQEFLLGGCDPRERSCRVSQTALFVLEIFERLIPARWMGYAALFFFLTVLPSAGVGLTVQTLGTGWSLAALFATALAGLILVWRNGEKSVHTLVVCLRQGEVPPMASLKGAMLTMSGLLLMLPGPVVNLAAALLLIPPITRLASLAAHRWLRKILGA